MADVPVDSVGAFVVGPEVLGVGAGVGRLAGTTFAAKDLFDVAGTVTGAGNPTFAAGRSPARRTATAVRRLLAAGSTLVGKTVTDELAYSLAGTNVHHGTPVNSAAPGHAPGGSSSGSAAAISAGLIDLALGTDTGGSIRVPASYGGLWGWRPTHGAVPIDGVVPLAPSFDTVGLLARDPAVLLAGAEALLRDEAGDDGVGAIAVIDEARDELAEPLGVALDAVARGLGGGRSVVGVSLDEAVVAFRILQGAEAWAAHGAWILAARPTFGPDIASRFEAAERITPEEVAAASVVRDRVRSAVLRALAAVDGTVLLQAAAAVGPPALDAEVAEVDRRRIRTLRQTCLAGLAGCPVVVVPILADGHLPLGLACLGAPGTDRALLAWAAATFGP